jgi:hypothetical protein
MNMAVAVITTITLVHTTMMTLIVPIGWHKRYGIYVNVVSVRVVTVTTTTPIILVIIIIIVEVNSRNHHHRNDWVYHHHHHRCDIKPDPVRHHVQMWI